MRNKGLIFVLKHTEKIKEVVIDEIKEQIRLFYSDLNPKLISEIHNIFINDYDIEFDGLSQIFQVYHITSFLFNISKEELPETEKGRKELQKRGNRFWDYLESLTECFWRISMILSYKLKGKIKNETLEKLAKRIIYIVDNKYDEKQRKNNQFPSFEKFF